MGHGHVSEIPRFPGLLFAAAVDRLRHVPGASRVGAAITWLPLVLLLAAAVLTMLWAAEVSPQRISLADLAAGRLGQLQSWVIVSGDLAEEPGSSAALHQYRLTHPAAPNAYLVVRSAAVQPLGRTTISGHIRGGREGVPPGYAWSAPLDADPVLASELPPPWTAIALGALAILVFLARRSRYPLFSAQRPTEQLAATSALRVTVLGETGAFAHDGAAATLSFASAEPGTANLSVPGLRIVPVRLHSAFTSVDVGVAHRLSGSEPALRLRSENDDLLVAFGSARERDSAFAALSAEAQGQRAGYRLRRRRTAPSELSR
jgi:hypothetical protein